MKESAMAGVFFLILAGLIPLKASFAGSMDASERPVSDSLQIQCRIKAPENDPIAYANVFIPGSGKGSTTNKAGFFEMDVRKKNLNDTFRVSAVGFKTRLVQGITLHRQTAITLQPKVYQAPTFTLNAPKPKAEMKKLGKWKPLIGGWIGMPEGHQAVTMIQSDNTRGFIKKVRIRVAGNSGRDLARLRIYANDNGKPGRHLLHKNLIKQVRGEKHWLVFNLKEARVPFNEACFVGYELLKVKGDLPQWSIRLWRGSDHNYFKNKGDTNWTKAAANHYVVQVFVRGGG